MICTLPFRSNRSPAAYRQAVLPEIFLKTHAIAASVNQRWSPRAFQKIFGETAQRSPLDNLFAVYKFTN
jgi:hypothetical protein